MDRIKTALIDSTFVCLEERLLDYLCDPIPTDLQTIRFDFGTSATKAQVQPVIQHANVHIRLRGIGTYDCLGSNATTRSRRRIQEEQTMVRTLYEEISPFFEERAASQCLFL